MDNYNQQLTGGNGDGEYDVVIDTLQTKIDQLWNMTKRNPEWGIMDQFRLEQIDELKAAIKLWKEKA